MKEYYFTDIDELVEYIKELDKENLQIEYDGLIGYIKNNSLINGTDRKRLINLIDSMLQ